MIEVLSPGLLTTVQDLGRPGWAHLGLAAGGAADRLSLRLGNRILGNAEGAPALEMTLRGGAFRFDCDARIALAGGTVEGAPVWTPLDIQAGQVLTIGAVTAGVRAYLCVRGGIDASDILGSASVHLPSGIGGGPLRRGQRLSIGTCDEAPPLQFFEPPSWRKNLRVTRGPQSSWFEENELSATPFGVTPECDRSGVRLRGTPIRTRTDQQMMTEGVPLGAVQIPPGGQPIIVFVDRHTTGGYPVAATVISADLPHVGQLRPGDHVTFEYVSTQEARRIWFAQESLLDER